MNKAMLFALGLALASSAGLARVKSVPDWTTYPRDQINKDNSQVSVVPLAWLPPSLGNVTVRTTTVGDDAQIEGFITPQSSTQFSEERLMALLDRYGEEECPSGHRVVETHYYYGTEATLKFARIENTPALLVRYRCSLALEIPKSNLDAIKLEKLSKHWPDSDFFDISSKRFAVAPETLFDAVQRAAIKGRMPIVQQDDGGGEKYLIAGQDENELRWGKIEKLTALVTKDAEGAVLTFRLHAYQLTYHERGVFETAGPTVPRGAQPWDRRTAYARAIEFLDSVDRQVAKGH